MSADLTIPNVGMTSVMAGWLGKRDALLDQAEGFTQVTSAAELEAVSSLDAQMKKILKEAEAKRKEYTSKLDAVKKSIMEEVRGMTAPLAAEEERLNKLGTDYATEQERKRRAELERIAELERKEAEAKVAKEEDDDDPFGPPSEPAAPTVARIPATDKVAATASRFVTEYKFDIVRPDAVPREFCTPDERKIRAYIQNAKVTGVTADQIHIPGIVVREVTSMRSK